MKKLLWLVIGCDILYTYYFANNFLFSFWNENNKNIIVFGFVFCTKKYKKIQKLYDGDLESARDGGQFVF